MSAHMSTSYRLIFLVIACGASLFASRLILDQGEARAHTSSNYFDTVWSTDTEYRIGKTAAPLDSSPFRARLEDAANEWNSLAGSTFDVTYNAAENDALKGPAASCTPTWTKVWVYSDADIGGNLGLTKVCLFSDQFFIRKAQIQFNPNRNWHNGVALPTSTQVDFWSVATHEFGHVTGFGVNGVNIVPDHFGSTVCSTSTPASNQSMCPGPYAAGWSHQRDLENHDIHTIEGWY